MSHTKLVGRFTVSRNSSDAENHCLHSTNRMNCLTTRTWLGDDWGVTYADRNQFINYLSFGINSLVECLTLLVNQVFMLVRTPRKNLRSNSASW